MNSNEKERKKKLNMDIMWERERDREREREREKEQLKVSSVIKKKGQWNHHLKIIKKLKRECGVVSNSIDLKI